MNAVRTCLKVAGGAGVAFGVGIAIDVIY